MSATTQQQSEALSRATNNLSMLNYPAIYAGFEEQGISDIQPRVNVFTYHAWRAKGLQVRIGEHGVKVVTWVTSKDKETGKESKFPKKTTVFHISQTDPIQ